MHAVPTRDLFEPATLGLSGKLGPVIATDLPGHTTRRRQLEEHVECVAIGDASVDLQGQALANVLVHACQPFQLTATRRSV
jgi:hypothetical protein